MKYLEFLNLLVKLGPKLKDILAWLQQGLELFKSLSPTPATGDVLQVIQPTPEESALEGQVALLVAGESAAFDGSRLRELFKFLQNSGLGQAILAILLKAVGG